MTNLNNLPEEQWLPVKNYEGFYEVSNLGRIKSVSRTVRSCMRHQSHVTRKERFISLNNTKCAGYITFTLCKEGKLSLGKVHRLVAEAFVLNPEYKPYVNHINGIKTDNRAENLEWVTAKENTVHASKMGLHPCGERNGNSKLNADQVRFIRLNKGVLTQRQIAKRIGVTQTNVGCILRNEQWKHLL